MSEGSLQPFETARRRTAPDNAPPQRPAAFAARLRGRLGGALQSAARLVARRFKRDVPGQRDAKDTSPELESRAATLVRGYLNDQATNLERAARLGEKADRLESAGTPSESARNRAERARREVAAGLDALRARFVESVGGRGEEREGARAFDRAVEALCPDFGPPGRPSAGRA